MFKYLSKFDKNNSYLVIRNGNKLLLNVLKREVTYEVLPSGERVVVNVNSTVVTKREKWQRVRPMGKEEELREIKSIELNERLESDPKVARNTAYNKLNQFRVELMKKGFCREIKPYNPPKDVQNIMQNICDRVMDHKSDEWTHILLNDPFIKYKFLTECKKSFNYCVPNSVLYLMKSVSDVYEFYSTPIRGITSYDQMVQNAEQLPKNVHVIGEPIRYNPENDEYFGGINAFPFNALQVTRGLRAKKKYPSFKSNFEWPDI